MLDGSIDRDGGNNVPAEYWKSPVLPVQFLVGVTNDDAKDEVEPEVANLANGGNDGYSR